MSRQTQACQTIINSIEVNLAGAQAPNIMMDMVLDCAQNLVNNDGYVWDVALAIACKMFPRTRDCGQYAYSK